MFNTRITLRKFSGGQTDGQTVRQTDRQTERQTDRKTDRETEDSGTNVERLILNMLKY